MSKAVVNNHRHLIDVVIMLFFMLVFKYIPPVGDITPLGMEVIGLLIGTVYGWVNFNFIMPTLLGLILLGTSECYASINDLFAASFASANAVTILGLCILSGWLTSIGLCDVIANFLMTRKFLAGRPWLFIGMFIFAAFVSATMTNSMGAVLIFLNIFYAQAKQLNMQRNTKLIGVYLGGLVLAGCLSELPLPVKGCAYIYISLYETLSGMTVDMLQYTAFMLPTCLLLLLIYLLVAKIIIKPDVSVLSDMSFIQPKEVTKQQKWALWSFLLLIILLMVPNYMPKSIPGVEWICSIGVGGTCLLFLAVVSFIKVDKEALLDVRAVMPSVALDPWFLTAGLMPLATCLTADATGVKLFLVNAVSPIVSNLSPYMAIVFIVIATTMVTQIANNMVVAIAFMTLAFSVFTMFPELNMFVIFCLVFLGAHISMVLPSANPLAAICFAQKDWIEFNNLFKVALVANISLIIAVVTVIYLYSMLIF